MYNEEVICMSCKDAEKKRDDYNQAVDADIIDYWRRNAEEDYITTPISVLRYITELEKILNNRG